MNRKKWELDLDKVKDNKKQQNPIEGDEQGYLVAEEYN